MFTLMFEWHHSRFPCTYSGIEIVSYKLKTYIYLLTESSEIFDTLRHDLKDYNFIIKIFRAGPPFLRYLYFKATQKKYPEIGYSGPTENWEILNFLVFRKNIIFGFLDTLKTMICNF